jgi:transcriptional regulator with XRE-family HTH domain
MYAMVDIYFPDWLKFQIDQRGWTQADLARYANTTRSAINGLIKGSRGPGADLSRAIAHAMNLPTEVVFRAAGLLPPKPAADEIIEQAEHIIKGYKSPETKARALAYLEFLRVEEEKAEYRAKPARRPASPEPG